MRVAAGYLGWNLLVVLPVCAVIMHQPQWAMPGTLAVLALAVATWWLGKGVMRRNMRRQGPFR